MTKQTQLDRFFENYPGLYKRDGADIYSLTDRYGNILVRLRLSASKAIRTILNDSYRQWKRSKKKGKR